MTTPEPRPGQGKVADRIAATLGAYGCRHAVGIPGNDVLETIRACEDHGIRFTLAKSEPSAAFMADAIYQITGAPVALIPALGPGIANAASGIAGALMERSALIVLTGGIAAAQDGLYTHQMFDHIALAAPITKHTAALNGTRPAQHVAKALDIALAYPAGPVMLNVPADLARATATETANFVPPVRASAQLDRDIAITLAARLSQAQRPVALIGRGALAPGVPEALTVLVEAYALPFFATYKAKGVVSERHPLSLGAVGLSPVVDGENMKRLREADLLLLVGFDPIELRDAWLDAWDPSVEIISIDWGPLPHRVFPVGTECLGDMPAILGQLLPAEPREPASTRHRTAGHWASGHRAAIAEIVKPRSPARGISPAALFAAVNRRLEQDWLLTVDVGAHRILANHVIECTAPGQLLQSTGLCCMGYAVPAAIGARIACPERPVIALVGDGCLLMSTGDLALAAELDLPIIIVVLNDDALSLIKLKQRKMQLEPLAVDFRSPRFDLIGQGFGASGIRVDSLAGFEAAFDAALAGNRLTVIDALVNPDEYMEQM